MTVSLPLFYFKPTVCWIDDDQILLDAIKLSFAERYCCLTFDNPTQAIKQLDNYHSPLSSITFKREFTESDLFGSNNHYPVDINIPAIKDLANLPSRMHEIAVIVVDYNMPDMNGLELCKQLSHLPIKKILLTGDATHEKAIDAFNAGLIHRYIKKDHGVHEEVKKHIDTLIYEYFSEKTSDVLSNIQASNLSLLSDKTFIDFFKSWLTENDIAEYYLINRQGSFLVKDKEGKESYFVIMSEKDKQEFLALNDETTEEPGTHLTEMAKGLVIPFFGVGKEAWQICASKWAKYFYEATVLRGREDYYWAVVRG